MVRFLTMMPLVALAVATLSARCDAQYSYTPGERPPDAVAGPVQTYSYAGTTIDDPRVVCVPRRLYEDYSVYLFPPTQGYGYAGCGGWYHYGLYGSPLYRNSPLAMVIGGRGNACPARLPCCPYVGLQYRYEYAYGAGGMTKPPPAADTRAVQSAPPRRGKAPPAMGDLVLPSVRHRDSRPAGL